MSVERIHVSLPTDLYAALEAGRKELGQSRAVFVRRALEAALGERPGRTRVAGSIPADPGPPRAPTANYGAILKPCPECGSVGPVHARGCKRA